MDPLSRARRSRRWSWLAEVLLLASATFWGLSPWIDPRDRANQEDVAPQDSLAVATVPPPARTEVAATPFPRELFETRRLIAPSVLLEDARREEAQARAVEEARRSKSDLHLLGILQDPADGGLPKALLYFRAEDRIVALRHREEHAGWKVERLNERSVMIRSPHDAQTQLSLREIPR